MIPNTKLRVVTSGGVGDSSAFGISINDSAHIMTLLRDTLYSDKELAVLREYSANAWDAHREAGKSDLPIKVTLPTEMDPTLSIRDYGAGLSHEDVFHVYTQYGASTKRDGDDQVGMYGIGSKSAFSYSESFTITSFNQGTKRIYVAALDPTEKGLINLLHEEPCGEETGVLIQVAVKPPDIPTFERKAKELFQYFNPRPDINTDVPALPASQVSHSHGVLYDDVGERRKWVAVMGCIPYRLNLEQLTGLDGEPGGGVAEFLNELSGALFFNIGELQISASREELKYNSNTKKLLVEKLNLLVEEYVRKSLQIIEAGGFSLWEKRVRAQVLTKMRLPVPADFKKMTVSHIMLTKDVAPKSVTFTHGKHAAMSITITKETRLLLRTDNRPMVGFVGNHGHDYVVRRTDKKIPWTQARQDIDAFCVAVGIDGIPILKTSEMEWRKPGRTPTGRTINEKHRIKSFQLRAEGYFRFPYSDAWTAVERTPTQDDVFAIILGFKSFGFDLFHLYRQDDLIATGLGKELPPIYGYKTTLSKPVNEPDCTGTIYTKWREEWVKTLLTPDVRAMLDHWVWANVLDDYGRGYRREYRYRDRDAPSREPYEILVSNLGADHRITKLIERRLAAQEFLFNSSKKSKLEDALDAIYERVKTGLGVDPAELELAAIRSKYRLLHRHGFSVLWAEDRNDWAHYIKLIDSSP